MTSRHLCLGIAIVCLCLGAAVAAEPEPGFVSMFDGKTLGGWEGAPEWWRVSDGAIVTESTAEKPCPRTQYLYWKGGEPADFDMRCLFRIGGQANSGIQFRSQKRPNWDTWGYQADLDTAGRYTGFVYQHGRGLAAPRGQSVVIDASGKKTATTFGDAAELLKVVKPNEWNEYRVLAEGAKIKLWINGKLMSELEDHEPKYALPKGIIALQIHKGPAMKAEFKDLRIRVTK